ncbi:RluA family pseudouridine synthase [Ammoniphilus sp. CFH 90114]|uniref:RluA family pseudouridine synthase n=1 Tax=Ammoniphilus sp. CFH 90114 TaxID=2493665 RepID=UPI00100E0FBD|nr:RluA family pseudouridine synthase [Ammoniphilus sp. CFH 90114]RXT08728.1 RluA family pseudouridine synthase [Ammoniphilus sp. CFH 90114]
MNLKPKIKGNWLEVTIEAPLEGKSIEDLLKEDLYISGRMIQRLTRQKGIYLNRKIPFLKKKVKEGDFLRVLVGDKDEGTLIPENIPIDVAFEDDEVLVVNKQAGIVVHPIKQGQTGTLAHGVAFYWMSKGATGKVRPVHRLDKDTSGLILIAKNSYIHQLLDRQLREQTIKRAYLTVVKGQLERKKGTIKEPIGQDPHNPVKRKVTPKGEEAITHYEVMEEFGDASLIRVELETGRTHQIRVHFEHIGHPVLGDSLYGQKHPWIQRQALHAYQLQFVHPFREEELQFEQPVPEDLKKLLEKLKESGPSL